MSFSYVEMEKRIYKVMEIVLSCPTDKWSVMAEKAGLDKDALFETLDYLDRENYLANIKFARGKGNRILIPFLENATISEKGLAFMKQMENTATDEGTISAGANSLPTIFISYCWDNDIIATKVDDALSGKAIVRRDKKDVPAWGNLSDFMKSIRVQDFAILIISEHYLKSAACLFEVMQLMKEDNWSKKAMYIVLSDANIYKPLGRAKYISYWTDQCEELEKEVSKLPASSTSELNQDLRRAVTIRDHIGEFLTKVADTSNPDLEKVIQSIIDRVEKCHKGIIPY